MASILLAWLVITRLLAGFALGAFFDSTDLVAPVSLVHFNPVVDGLEFAGVEPIETASASPTDGNQPDAAEDAEVLGDGRLREAEGVDQVSHGVFAAAGEQVDDPPAARFGDGVEDVGGRGCSCHAADNIPIWE
jgi:hypothetical protein